MTEALQRIPLEVKVPVEQIGRIAENSISGKYHVIKI